MNICYLKFINFSLGAGGMVRQNLQWNNSNDTFSHSAYLRQFSPVRMSTAAFENIPRERAASVRPDSVAMFSSFPERNTSLRPPPRFIWSHALSCLFSAARSNASAYQRIPAPLRLRASLTLKLSLCPLTGTWTPPVVITERNVKISAHRSIEKAQISFSCLSLIFN